MVRARDLGDRDAFAWLYDRHYARTVHYIRKLGAWEMSEDLAQTLWLRMWECRRTYRPDGRQRSWQRWAYAIASRMVGRAARRRIAA